MFAQILRTHWAWTRALVGVLALLTFVTPAFVWRLANLGTSGAPPALALMEGFAAAGVILAFLAVLGAFAIAAQPWTVDAATNHVYPLSLPIPWARYLAMRYSAGALMLLGPTLALWLGCVMALAMVELPDVLRSYAGALALRFLLASLLAYSATFALQHLAGRRAPMVLLVSILALVVVGFGVGIVAGRADLVDATLRLLIEWPGPFAIFTEPWVLVDV